MEFMKRDDKTNANSVKKQSTNKERKWLITVLVVEQSGSTRPILPIGSGRDCPAGSALKKQNANNV